MASYYSDPYPGIDVSMYQPDIRWSDIVNAGIKYAWIKVSEGVGYTDPSWGRHRAEARKTDILWGGYHFARPSGGGNWRSDCQSEAEWFANNGGNDGPLPGCLDLEASELDRDTTIQWSHDWCQIVADLTGRLPVVYVGAYFPGGQAIMNDPRLKHLFWWMPGYTSSQVDPNPDTISHPATNGPRKPECWQYTSQGRIPGYGGDLDLNTGSKAAILAICGEEPEPEKPKDDDDMKAIWWSAPNSAWVRDVANQDGSIPQAFFTAGLLIKYLGSDPNDPIVVAARNLTVLDSGHPVEAKNIPDESFQILTFIADSIPQGVKAVHTSETGDAQYLVVLDGNGKPCKIFLTGNAGTVLKAAGYINGTAHFDADLASALADIPDAPVTIASSRA
jgi:GH25 family lysozyme M1 (1,4-beta-N-acetylmuramidase)